MSSSRLDLGLRFLARGDFINATSMFRSLPADKKNSTTIQYYYAVSTLGALLTHLSKESKTVKENKKQSQSYLSSIKQSVFESIQKIIKRQPHDTELKHSKNPTSPQTNVIEEAKEELHTIQLQFLHAKIAMRPKVMGGMEYALNHIIKNISAINLNEANHRAKLFSNELIKFRLFYSLKLFLTHELENFEKDYYFRIFMPQAIKRLRNIVDINKNDLLFLSYDQLDRLYKELQDYRYNEKYHNIFKVLQENILFDSGFYYDKEYIEIMKNYKGRLNIENVILIHDIYHNSQLNDLRIIVYELNQNGLLKDDFLQSVSAILTGKNNYSAHIKHVANNFSVSLLPNKNKLLLHWFGFAFNKIPHPKSSDYQFNKYIAHIKTSCLSHEDKIDRKQIYNYLNLYDLLVKSEGNVPLNQICDLMRETEAAIGRECFIEICERILKYHITYMDFITILNFGLQFRKDTVKELLQLIDHYHSDFHVLKDQANDFLIKEYQSKFPERPLEEILRDFLTKSDDVEFTIDSAELQQVEKDYLKIKHTSEKLIMAGRLGLQSELKKCQKTLSRDSENETALLTLLAIIRLQVKDKLGIYPYNIQMLNLLILLNQSKRIAQIKTGEGKSTLIAMLAAFFGLRDRTVDIITTSHDLAMRDAKKFQTFYHALGLGVGHNVGKDKQNPACYEENIILYGTVSDFEFAYLRGETGNQSQGRGNRSYHAVIVDEVDSMFIDMQRNQAILSQPHENTYDPKVYKHIWHWINKTEKEDHTKENLQAMLKTKEIEVDLELANTWLKSALTAQRYTEEKEYIIAYPENESTNVEKKASDRIIKIVNKSHTGEIQEETTRWQGGLHELLEVKHKLNVRAESLTLASICHIDYFNKYKILMGLTGTLGSKASRDELNRLYKVTTYDSPPYKASMKKQIPHLIVKDEKTQMHAIHQIALQQIEIGRPVLTLCQTIQDSKNLNNYLYKDIKSTQMYNGLQTLSADAIFGLAGNPGNVTIATNLAGRGADIVTTPDAEEQGGLHVCMTFPAINQRVEQQAFGRTGRQGKKGTYHYILHENQLSDSEKLAKTIDEKISIMRANRDAREKMISADNIYYYSIIHKLFIIQTIFFALPTQIKTQHMTEWAIFKTKTNKLIHQYIGNELDASDEDVLMLDIVNQFNNFWELTFPKYDDNYKTPLHFVKSCLEPSISDEQNKKKLFFEMIFFLEDPKINFSLESADLWLELRFADWPQEKTITYSKNKLLHFKQSKTACPSPSEQKNTAAESLKANVNF